MSLRFIDGFDHYNSGTQKWTSAGTAFNYTSTGTRFGVGACITGVGATCTLTKGFGNQATWIVGIAAKFGTLMTDIILGFKDTGLLQFYIGTTTSGALTVTGGGVAASTANGTITTGVWYYLELKTTINNTTGSYEVRMNGINVLSGSGVDTQSTANAYANELYLASVFGASNSYDDLYLCDGTGSTNNNFLGDVRVDTIRPTADGSSTDFTPSTGTDNYAMVDDTTPDSDSTYVSSSTLNHVDLYTYSDLQSLTGSIFGIQSAIFGRKDDAGTRSVAPVIKTGATTAVGSDFVLSASYVYGLEIFETNPANGGAAWTISDVNNSEFGIKLTA